MARHRLPIPLRWSDFDALAHVNNVRYFEFMQDARVSIVNTLGLLPNRLTEVGHFVAHNEIDYIAPIGMDVTEIEIDIWVTKIGGASYTVRYEVLDERGTLYAKAMSVMVCVDMRTQAVTRVPDDMREALAQFIEPDAA